MAIRRHKYPSTYKCLLHFDYDYPESVAAAATSVGCGGLRDETGLNAWGINGTCRMVGQEAPAVAMDGTPKFGWRCVHFAGANDYIHALNRSSGVWNLKAKGRYEIDFFMRPTSAVAGGVISLRSAAGDVLKLTMDSGYRLVLNCPEWNITNATSAHALTQNVFNFVTLRVAGGHAVVYADGREFLSADIGTDANLAVSEVRLGGYVGQMDEFRFVHSAGSGVPQIPSVPHGGAFDIHTIGGFGNGSYGDANMMQAGHVRINTYAPVTSISGSSLSIGPVKKGIYGDLSSGDEVMIHLSGKRGSVESELGFYAVRRIQSIFAGVVSLDRPIADEFTAAEAAANYRVQIVSIPNFKTLSVSANTTIVPLLWDGSCGGLVAFKTQGQCTIDGKIITESAGPRRTDAFNNLAHTDMAERFILTGNVFIACGGTFSTSDDSRIGAAYPGDAKGSVGFGADGTAPSNSPGPSQKGLGGAPGRGGGGGKMARAVPGIYGVTGCSGGGGGGGGRGKGGNGQNCQYDPNDHLGLNPPPGGYGGTVGSGDGETGSSAPNVFIAAKRLRVSTASISTGGAGGGGGGAHSYHSVYPGAGGGAGGANEGVAPVVAGKGGKTVTGDSFYDGEAGTAVSGGIGGKAWGNGNSPNHGGAGGIGGGAGYGGSGGSAGSVFPNPPGQGYTSSISGAGGGGAGTGFCYLSYEELI